MKTSVSQTTKDEKSRPWQSVMHEWAANGGSQTVLAQHCVTRQHCELLICSADNVLKPGRNIFFNLGAWSPSTPLFSSFPACFLPRDAQCTIVQSAVLRLHVVCNPSPKLQSLLTDCKFGQYIHMIYPNKSLLNIWEKREREVSRDFPNFWSTPYYLRNG